MLYLYTGHLCRSVENSSRSQKLWSGHITGESQLRRSVETRDSVSRSTAIETAIDIDAYKPRLIS